MNPLKILLTLLMFLSFVHTAKAGPFSDELSQCLVTSTTPEDRSVLVLWMFSAMSRHPDLPATAAVSDEQLATANRKVADLTTRLLTDTCRSQAIEAIEYEGMSTIEESFSVLGAVAGKEIFNAPEVGTAVAGMAEFLDEEKLGELAESLGTE
ncbi:MAG: hypothetical protein AAF610_09055 [Pseudomonadota bacterium]